MIIYIILAIIFFCILFPFKYKTIYDGSFKFYFYNIKIIERKHILNIEKDNTSKNKIKFKFKFNFKFYLTLEFLKKITKHIKYLEIRYDSSNLINILTSSIMFPIFIAYCNNILVYNCKYIKQKQSYFKCILQISISHIIFEYIKGLFKKRGN